MNIVNTKNIFLLLALLFQVYIANAQENFDRLHGTYKGTASTETIIAEGKVLQGSKNFNILIEKKGNDTKLILQNYKIGNLEFKDIIFGNLTATYQPENKRWILTVSSVFNNYAEIKNSPLTPQINGTVIGNDNYVYDNGNIEFNFEMSTNERPTIKNLFKGKNNVAAGIHSISNKNSKSIVYDLHGRHVQNPRKGLYIINGKKVLLNNN